MDVTVFENAGFQPTSDQVQYPRITDAMLDEANV
jgi:hypothetical protein